MNKMCSKCKEIKGLNQFYRQSKAKDGLTAWCKICKKLDTREWTLRNKESELERQRDRYAFDPSHKNEQNKIWQKRNKGRVNAITAKRRAAKKLASPKWLAEIQVAEIRAIYEKASKLTELTNIRHEVDHIVPLQGKEVCGLHVPWNLQILTKYENLVKELYS